MRTALGNLEEPVGFTIRPRQSRRYPAEKLADVEFADDVALITDTIKEAPGHSYSVLMKWQGLYLFVSTPRPIPAPLVSSKGCVRKILMVVILVGSGWS